MMVEKFPELIKDNDPRFRKTKPKQDLKKQNNTKTRKRHEKKTTHKFLLQNRY